MLEEPETPTTTEHQSQMLKAAVEAKHLLIALYSQCADVSAEEMRLEELEEMHNTDSEETYWRVRFSFLERNDGSTMYLFNTPDRVYKDVMLRKDTLEVIALQSVQK